MSKKRAVIIYISIAVFVAFVFALSSLLGGVKENNEQSEDAYLKKEDSFCVLLMGKWIWLQVVLLAKVSQWQENELRMMSEIN